MFGIPLSISSFVSPMFWTVSSIGAYFVLLAIAEKRGKDVQIVATLSGITLAICMFIYCLMKFAIL